MRSAVRRQIPSASALPHCDLGLCSERGGKELVSFEWKSDMVRFPFLKTNSGCSVANRTSTGRGKMGRLAGKPLR